MRVLGIITARGGSKGVPRKNIRPLGGRPLLAWTAESARTAKRLTRTIISTDDAEIAECARTHGIHVPFLRPSDLALDTTPTLPVLQHAVRTLEEAGERYDAICLLQPTSPFRAPELLERTAADSVVTVLLVPDEHNPHWVYFADSGFVLRPALADEPQVTRRQDLPPAYHRDGAVYLMRRDVLMEQGSLYGARTVGHVVDSSRSVNIDRHEDWERAEGLATRLDGAD
jgi:CMP-N-acetylneuraminic acid synthetase